MKYAAGVDVGSTYTKAVILDLGVGNLGNVSRALRHVGGDVDVTTDPGTVADARCLVLPGVGAFRPPRERPDPPASFPNRARCDRRAA